MPPILRTEVVLTMVSLLMLLVISAATKCGPRKICSCIHVSQTDLNVDCKETNITAAEACEICSIVENVALLDLSTTDLIKIPDNCFSGCSKLRDLRLANNGLFALAEHTFNAITKLERLDLSRNNLIKHGNFSYEGVFRGLTGLKILYLQGNTNITTAEIPNYFLGNLPNDSFRSLSQLYIDGVNNLQFNLNFKYFKELISLRFDGIGTRCSIVHLTNKTFMNVPYLKHLNLAHCDLSYIDSGTFELLHQLMHLNLSYNRGLGLVTLPNVSYGLQFTNIKVLDYSKVTKTFSYENEMLLRCNMLYLNNTGLEELHMSANGMMRLETNVPLMFPKSLKISDMKENLFVFNPYVLQLGCFENIVQANAGRYDYSPNPLRYNIEASIPEKPNGIPGECQIPKPSKSKPHCPYFEDNEPLDFIAFALPPNLEVLGIKGTEFIVDVKGKVLIPEFRNNLKHLDLADNLIGRMIDKYFVKLIRLEFLNVTNNAISTIPKGDKGTMEMIPNIETLDVSKNFLGAYLSDESNEDLLKPLTNLKCLNVSQNEITRLPMNIFTNQSALSELVLSSNSLSAFNVSLDDLKHLSRLDLRQNKISSLPVKLLNKINETGHASIDLSDNPLELSCGNLEFLHWIVSNPSCFENLDSYRYGAHGTYSLLSHKSLIDTVNTLDNKCEHNTRYFILTVIVSLLIVSFIVLIVVRILYRFRWRVQYLYYMAKAQHEGYKQSQPCPAYTYDAFVSYAEDDYLFIKNEMILELEETFGRSLCIHERDFVAGRYVAENILHAIKESKTTIAVLSNHFLESKWCIYEFNMARMESMYSRNGEKVLLCVRYGDIDMARVSAEMLDCLDTQTFLEYPEDETQKPYFWEMLNKALQGRDVV